MERGALRGAASRRGSGVRFLARLATLATSAALLGTPLLNASPLARAAESAAGTSTQTGAAVRANAQGLAVRRSAIALPATPSAGLGWAAQGAAIRSTIARPSRPTKVTPINKAWGPSSRTYANPDGSYTTDFFTDRVNFRGPGNTWIPIDTTLAPSSGTYDWTVRANDVSVALSDANASAAAAQLIAGPYRLQLRVPGYGPATTVVPGGQPSPSPTAPPAPSLGPSPPPAPIAPPTSSPLPSAAALGPLLEPASPLLADPVVPPSGLVYVGASGGDVTVTPTTNGFDFGATLSGPAAGNVYAYALDLGPLQATLDPDGQAVTFVDPTANPPAGQSGPVVVGHVDRPGLTDAAGLGGTGDNLSVALVRPGDTSYPAGVDPATVAALTPTEILLVYTIDPTWLSDPLRTYPVSLDPSVCIENSSGCTSGEISTFLMQGKPTTYPVGWTVDRLGVDSMGTGYGLMRTLNYFPSVVLDNGTGSSDGSQITSAILTLHQTANYGTTSTAFREFMVIGTWSTTSTWTGQPHITGTGQSAAMSACSSSCAQAIDVTTITRSWYTRRGADWQPNLGFMGRLTDESKPEIHFDNNTTTTTTNRPKLTITYVVPAVGFDFASELGPNYAPSAMPAGQVTQVPIIISNHSSFSFNHANGGDLWRYQVGYRWFDVKGTLVTSSTVDLPADIPSGGSSGTLLLPVTAPASPVEDTLRLDLVHTYNGTPTLWSSDWATPSLYYARDKRTFDPASTRWVGGSIIERDEFPIAVLAGGGTATGDTKAVALGDGSTVSINLWSRDFVYQGTGGIGFSDLLPVGLTYGYDQGYKGDCNGVLAACGWSTNVDERLTPEASAGDYTYRAPDGNRYLVGTDANGQLISAAPVSLQRIRFTLFDDNTLPWTPVGSSPNVTYSASTVYEGAFSTSLSNTSLVNGQVTASLGSSPVSLNGYPLLNLEIATGSTSRYGGIGFQITDTTTGVSKWFGYGIGSTFVPPGMDWSTNLGAATGGWQVISPFVWNDVYNNRTLFGSGATVHDQYLVTTLKLATGGSTGTAYFDAAWLNHRTSLAFDESQPAWTTGSGYASLNSTDYAVGTHSIAVAPASVATSPTVSGMGQQLSTFPFLRWYWKKVGGTTVAIQLGFTDVSASPTRSGFVTYYAGANAGYPNDATHKSIQVAPTIPDTWTPVTRDIEDDARQLLGFYNDTTPSSLSSPSGGPIPDDLQWTSYTLVATDGSQALFDQTYIVSQSGVDPITSGPPTGAVSEDFVATEASGVQHFFNRDGLLTRIVDRDGHAEILDWTYNTGGSGQSAYSLQRIHAPSDGQPLSSGTAQREIALTYATNKVTFTEQLGSTTSFSGRYTEFDRTTGGDLTTVVPARYDAACGIGSTPQGCLTFDYTDSSSHYLYHIYDPRHTSANTFSTRLGYSGVDPFQITDESTSQLMLSVLTYADTRPGGSYQRVIWQNQAGLAANAAAAEDLTPEGAAVQTYQPKGCTGTCAQSNLPPAAAPADLSAATAFDGVAHATTATSFRTAGGARVISRRGTLAGLAVDNLADPLTAAETAWTQSPDQYFASHAAGTDELYRTSYTYNALHEAIDELTPAPNDNPTPYQTQLLATSPAADWRLGETSGTTAADSSGHGLAGTYTGGYSQGQAGAIVGDANPAVALDGASGRITSAATVGSSAYTMSAWVKVASVGQNNRGIAGRWLNGAGSGALLFLAGGRFELVQNATYVASSVVAQTGNWYHVVATWDGGTAAIYVNGALNATVPITTPPGAGGTNFEIGSYSNAQASTFLAGSVDEVAIWNRALDAATIKTLYAAGGAFVSRDLRTTYDTAGHPTVRWDNTYLSNADFEAGPTAWTLAAGASVITSPAGQIHGGVRALALTGTGSATQTAQLVGGQTARFQFWGLAASGASVGYHVTYYDTATASWRDLLAAGSLAPASYTSAAWDLTIPVTGDGRVQVTFSNATGTGTANVDDVGLFTTYSGAAYSTAGITGLLTDTYSPNAKSDGSQASALVDTHLAYAASTTLPAILPTSSTANDLTGSYHATAPDADLTTTTTYDTWGRLLSATDPDGVATTTAYQSNQTDVASVTDGAGDATTYVTDEVGNRTSVATPKTEATTTTFDLEGHPLIVTGPSPFPVKTVNSYAFGQLTNSIANYGDGSPSGPTAADDVKTTTAYDANGYLASVIVDDGTGMVQSETVMANDLLGNAVTTTHYADSAHTQARTTSLAFDQTGAAPTITRAKPSGSQGPINPTTGHLCGGSLSGYCNSAAVLDLAGRPVTTYDAYGIPTAHALGLTGRDVRTTADLVTGTWNPASPDQDVTTTKTYDIAGDLTGQIDTLGHVTTALYDAVGRKTKTIAPDSSWTETFYTAAGRVDVASRVTDATIADTDSSVAWTKSLYDLAGRQTATLAHYDRPGLGAQPNQQLGLSSFEDGLDGWSGAATGFFTTAAGTLALDTSAPGPATGQQRLQVTTNASLGGATLTLAGIVTVGHTYRLHATVTAPSGKTVGLYLGQDASGGSFASTTTVGDGTPHGIDLTWAPGSTFTAGVRAAVRAESGQGNVVLSLDDVSIWDAGAADRNIASLTVYDPDSHAIESVLPGGHAGDAPLVTLTAYDALGRVTDVTVNDIAGAGTSAADVNLVSHSDYDNLGRVVDTIDPTGITTSYVYDRLNDVLSTTQNDTGASWSATYPDRNVRSSFAYDALGELTGTCPARNQEAGLTCNPASGSDANAWEEAYDAAGHLVSETPPTVSSITQLDRTLWTYDAGGRLTETCDVAISASACSSATRYTDQTYDKLGRAAVTTVSTGGAPNGTPRLVTTNTYLGDGFRSQVAFDGTGSSPSEGTDAITFTEDALGRMATEQRGSATLTAYTYYADGAPQTRTDTSGIVTSFTEDWAGRPTATAAASLASIAPTQSYRLDGLLDGRTWPTTNAVASLAYDGAKRPKSLSVYGSGIAAVSVTQAYDRAGNVTSEGRTLQGISGNAGTGAQSFTYDGLHRVASATLGGTTTTYGYDGDGNRTSVVVVGATTTSYAYDTTDELVSVSGGTVGSFAYDAYGNQTANAETGAAGTTAYAYDTGDRLLTITPPASLAKVATFTYDALGRPATRSVATTPNVTVDTYSYAGIGKVVSQISTRVGTGSAVPLDALVGADGSRLAENQNAGAAFGWLMPDLHGNVAAVATSSLASQSDAIRYDAFGQVAASVTSSLPTPWRYQGRLLVDPTGATDLYDAGARLYTPGLGGFTQEDSVSGSAQDPLSMNRYLFAEANPATLIDPNGHAVTGTTLLGGCNLGYQDCAAVGWKSFSSSQGQTYVARRAALHRADEGRRIRLQTVYHEGGRSNAPIWGPLSEGAYEAMTPAARTTYAKMHGQDALTWLTMNGRSASPEDVLLAWYTANEWHLNGGGGADLKDDGRPRDPRASAAQLTDFLSDDQIAAYLQSPSQNAWVTLALIGVTGLAGQSDRPGGTQIGNDAAAEAGLGPSYYGGGGSGLERGSFIGKNMPDRAATAFGLDRRALGDLIEQLKQDMGMRGDDALAITPSGEIVIASTGEAVGHVSDVGGSR